MKGCYFPNARGKPESLALSFDFNSSCQSGQESLTSRAQHATPARSIREPPHTHTHTQVYIYSVSFCKTCLLLQRLSRQTVAAVSRLHIFVSRTAAEETGCFFPFFSVFSRVKTKTHCTPSARTSQLKLQSATADVAPRLCFSPSAFSGKVPTINPHDTPDISRGVVCCYFMSHNILFLCYSPPDLHRCDSAICTFYFLIKSLFPNSAQGGREGKKKTLPVGFFYLSLFSPSLYDAFVLHLRSCRPSQHERKVGG